MPKYIWSQINVWFGKETTRGTAVAVTKWQPKTDFTFDETVEKIQDESTIGNIVDSRDAFIVKQYWTWDIGWNIEVNQIWIALLWLLWEVASVEDSTGAYKHTFNLKNTNQTQSLTIWINDPVEWDISYPLAMIDEMTISANQWEFATFSITFKSKPWETATHSVSYDVDYKLLARHSIFKIADNLAWLDWASAICLRSFEITVSKNLEEDYCMWSITPRDFINQMTAIEWSFTAVYETTTLKDLVLDNSKKSIRFELLDTATTIWASSNPRLTIDLPLANFTEFTKDMSSDATVVQTLTFKALYSETDWSAIDVELVNTTETY